jgi:hypothetical protein
VSAYIDTSEESNESHDGIIKERGEQSALRMTPMTTPVTFRRSSDTWLWIAAALSFGISLTRWGPLVLYPFRLFTTWVHECGYAVMTLLVGGHVNSIIIERNAAGVTSSLIPRVVAQGLVASAGYLGASVVGCALMMAARGKKGAHGMKSPFSLLRSPVLLLV